MVIAAKVVKDSISPSGVRLTTLQFQGIRYVHGEFLTHRVLSRNASSSRAIPVAKEIDRVVKDPVFPPHWGKNQPGMQAREQIDLSLIHEAMEVWQEASEDMCYRAGQLAELGVHKQVANRLLEPFQWIDVVVTATEWDNFFSLRDHDDADPAIHQLAQRMREAMAGSTPTLLHPGEWHLPYVDLKEIEREQAGGDRYDWTLGRKLSTARCARVSYRNHDGSEPNVEKDIGLYETLKESRHLSPFEHQGTPMAHPTGYDIALSLQDKGATHMDIDGNWWSGNFRNWVQHRQAI